MKIKEACEILGDEMKRKEYDMGSAIDPLQNILRILCLNKRKNIYNGIKQPINIKRQIINGQSTNYEIEKIYADIPRGVDDDEIIKKKKMTLS